MQEIRATVVSVHVGASEHLAKEERPSISVELDGIVGDKHRSYTRECWSGDKQAKGTVRRNERQWSAASVEELAKIEEAMGLAEPLTAEEYNPPCLDAGTQLADKLQTSSGERLDNTAFSKAGKLLRGLVGSVEVAGTINAGDDVEVTAYEHASWLARST